MKRRFAPVFALLLGLPGADAKALEATLAVSPLTSLVVTVDAIDAESAPLVVSGHAEVTLEVEVDPSYGTVVTAVEGTGGRFTFGDLSLDTTFATHVTLQLTSVDLSAEPGGPVVTTLPTGPLEVEVELETFNMRIDSGSATINGVIFGGTVFRAATFTTVSALELRAASGRVATIVTNGATSGPVGVTVTIPVDALLLALDTPLQVPLRIEGQLVLAGTAVAAPAVPVLQGFWLQVVAALLLLTSGLAWLRGARRPRATARSRTEPD